MSKYAVETFMKTIKSSFADKKNIDLYTKTIDTHLGRTAAIYSAPYPTKRPTFFSAEQDAMYEAMGVTKAQLDDCIKVMIKSDSRWKIQGVNHAINLAVCLNLTYFIGKNDEKQIINTLSYMICFQYVLLHHKYYRAFKEAGPPESVMMYTVNNLSDKFRLRGAGNMWNLLYETTRGSYEFHKQKLKGGEDQDYVRFIADTRTRLSNIMKALSNEFYDAYTKKNYLQTEADIMDEEKYHEVDNNTQAVERITNQTLTKLLVNGPDAKLVQMAAKSTGVSVNLMRNYCNELVNEDHREDLRNVMENLLFMYLNSEDEPHTVEGVHSNDFMIYCMKVYKKAHTGEDNVLRIKDILNKWLIELGIQSANTNSMNTTVSNFRRALYLFIVLTIIKG